MIVLDLDERLENLGTKARTRFIHFSQNEHGYDMLLLIGIKVKLKIACGSRGLVRL